MTENEAIERLECMRLFMQINDKSSDSKFLEDDYIANQTSIKALEEIQQYRALGTVEELREATEKQRAKKLLNRKGLEDFNGKIYAFRGDCARCGLAVGLSTSENYCSYCGQAIDWSEEE